MNERRYTDEEVAEIFARASESERATPTRPAGGTGLSLTALQEIGREVGISPDAIGNAARSLDLGGHPGSRTYLGLPIGVGRTIELDRPITDADWERLVGDLRDTFHARGTLRVDGSFRQWTNGNLQALVEPTAGGFRLRLQTTKGDSRRLMTAGGVLLGVAAVVGIATVAVSAIASPGAGGAGAFSGIGFLSLAGLGMFAIGAVRLPAWARRRREQFDAICARLAAADAHRTPDRSITD